MNGTSISANAAIRRMPPRITAADTSTRTKPTTGGEKPNVASRLCATEFACTMLPMPKAASAVSSAKIEPSQGNPSRRNVYIAPPRMTPAESRSR